MNNSIEIEHLKIYAVKARKMIDIELDQKSLNILLEELDRVSQNIGNEIFECNMDEDCVNCGFSGICIKVNKEGTSVFEFNKNDKWGFRDKFYQYLPEYEIIDLKDDYWQDLEFNGDDDFDECAIESKSEKSFGTDAPKNKQKSILKIKEDNVKSFKEPEKQDNIKSSKFPPKYDVDYFKNLADIIKENPNFISDRDLLNHEDDEFIPIDDIAHVKMKADLKEKGKKLENDDVESAVEFYDELKSHRLFANDYYPYRRQCILFKNKLKDDLRDWQTIEEILAGKIYLNHHHQ